MKKIVLDYQRHLVLCDKKYIRVSPLEFRILSILVKASGKVLSPGVIKRAAGMPAKTESLTVAQHICRIRRKLGPGNAIITVPKSGYHYFPYSLNK